MGKILDDSTILITGGTGSFGHSFVRSVLENHKPKKIIIYSRDEYKQWLMATEFSQYRDTLRFFLGDVRDPSRLHRALDGVDYVVHAAALKQVPALEYNPTEAIQTNIKGTENVVNASANSGVKKSVVLSTDKAVNPVNLYGATKLVAEKLFISGNSYVGGKTKFCAVRYGNVIGSRGSVIPLFVELKRKGVKEFPITDMRMTRFWITLLESVQLVITALSESRGGEVFVPRIPSMKIADLAKAIDPDCTLKETGIRPGEKLHEVLISTDESRCARLFKNLYVIVPSFSEFFGEYNIFDKYSLPINESSFTSDNNPNWISYDNAIEIMRDNFGEI